jgi:stage V sporulation protein B
MKNKSFLNGAFILAVAGIISKFIGFFFKVPITRLIGAEGLGLYNYPYNLYSAMLAISITGLPVAISKLVSERIALKQYRAVHKVFKVALILMSLVGIFTSAVLFAGSKIIVNKFWPPGAYYPLMGLVFAPIFVASMSVFRGYFQGMQLMMPTAISQIFESFGRLIVGLGLAYFFVNKGIPYAAGGASFGATAGAVLGLIVLIISYLKIQSKLNKNIQKHKVIEKEESSIFIITKILSISVPISIGAVASSMMSLIDSLMINSRLLIAGFSVKEASVLYGQLGTANTLINFPLTISIAIAASIVPAISEAKVHENYHEIRQKLEEGIKMGFYIGLPATIGLFILADPILAFIFPTINGGGKLLQLLAVALIFITLNQILTGALQGFGKIMIPVKNLFLGSVVKVIVSYFLTIQPAYNIKGAAIGTIIGYLIALLLNYKDIKKYTKRGNPRVATINRKLIYIFRKDYYILNDRKLLELFLLFLID